MQSGARCSPGEALWTGRRSARCVPGLRLVVHAANELGELAVEPARGPPGTACGRRRRTTTRSRRRADLQHVLGHRGQHDRVRAPVRDQHRHGQAPTGRRRRRSRGRSAPLAPRRARPCSSTAPRSSRRRRAAGRCRRARKRRIAAMLVGRSGAQASPAFSRRPGPMWSKVGAAASPRRRRGRRRRSPPRRRRGGSRSRRSRRRTTRPAPAGPAPSARSRRRGRRPTAARRA